MTERETAERPDLPTLSISEKQYRELKDYGERTGMSVNMVVHIAIREFIDRILERHINKQSKSVKINFRRRN